MYFRKNMSTHLIIQVRGGEPVFGNLSCNKLTLNMIIIIKNIKSIVIKNINSIHSKFFIYYLYTHKLNFLNSIVLK